MQSHPDHNLKLMFRFFHFYTAKLLYPLFSTPIETAKFMSLFYANIIVVMTYLTGRFVSINSAFFATVFVMFNPTLLYQSTWFGTDLSMTALGLLSMFFYFTYLKYKHKTLIMLSGFFLIASIFSKQTGIVFSLPIIILISMNSLNNKNNLFSSLVFLTLGGALCLLYISLCSLIFNNDFFYFINPQTYLEFLERFDNQLTNDSIKKIKKMPTYLDSLINTSPISILYFIGSIFGCTFLALSQIWNFQHNLITKNVIMFTFILFLSVLFLHEIFHISFYGLRLHPRYLLPTQICVAITFGVLISLYKF